MRRLFLSTIALLGLCAAYAYGDYTATQGTGTTFGSVIVSGAHYVQQFICDLTVPSRCATVSAAGAVKVDGSAATQPVSGTFWQTTQPVSGTVTANSTLAAETTKVIGTVNQGTSPWVIGGAVTNAGTFAVQAASTLAAETTKVIGTINVAAAQTIAVTNSGTFAVQAAATLAAETTKVIGTVNIAAAQTIGLAAGSAVIGHIICDSGCSGSTAPADEAAFTAGTTPQTPVGGFFQTTATSNALTNGQMGAWQFTANRAGFVNLRTAAGAEIGTSGAEVFIGGRGTAGTPAGGVLTIQGVASMTKLLVTPDSVALPANQSVNVSQFNGVTPLMGNGVAGTGAQRVTIASDNTAFSVNAAVTAASGSIASGAVASGAFASGSIASGAMAAGSMVDLLTMRGTKAAGTAAANSLLTGCVYNSSGVAPSDGQQVAVQCDSTGAVRVGGGLAAASTTSGQTGSIIMGTTVTAPRADTNGQTNFASLTVSGATIVAPYSNPENFVSGVITSAMTGTTTTSLIAAPAAGLRNYITQCTFSNSHATVGTDMILQDGSGGTTIYLAPTAPAFGGATITFPTPLRQPTTATALYVANVTTGSNTKAACSGYKGP